MKWAQDTLCVIIFSHATKVGNANKNICHYVQFGARQKHEITYLMHASDLLQ